MGRTAKLILVLAVVCGLGVVFADSAAAQCQAAKSAKVAAKTSSCCDKGAFPAMKSVVAGKTYACPVEAKEASAGKTVTFVVAGKTYTNKNEAMVALADSSEKFVKRFTSIACVIDGKANYCGEGDCGTSCSSKVKKTGASEPLASTSTCSASKTVKLVKVDGKSSCCQSKGAKTVTLAKANHCGNAKGAKTVKLAKVDGKSSCSQSKGAKAVKLAKADSCCATKGAKGVKLAKAAGTCSATKTVKLAKIDDKSSCCQSKGAKAVKLAKADSCCATKGAKAVKLAKATGTCSATKTVKLAKVDDKSSCCQSKGAKAVKLAKAAGTCSATKTVKLAKADSCCATKGAKAVKLVKVAEKTECCKVKEGKTVTYLVVGREFKDRLNAVKARDKALSAMKTVAIKYVVDGKTYDCSSKVCPSAMSAGKVDFVVNDSKTRCKIQARILMAKAQYEAARGIATKLARL